MNPPSFMVVHEDELTRRPDLAATVREIDRLHPPVGYERLLYPWLLIIPGEGKYARLIQDTVNQLVIPLLPVEELVYRCLTEHCKAVGSQLLLVDTRHDWLSGDGLRLVPIGALQNIDLDGFHLDGGRMRRLRYMVNRFSESGGPRTVEYFADQRPPFEEMLRLLEAWGKAKRNVIWHTALCMEHLLKGELPPGHRAFLTYHQDRLCSIIVLEACGENGYLMDQEFYDPESAPLGHMEYAIVAMIELLKKEGVKVFSLGVTWYPFQFENHPDTDPGGWEWLKRANAQPTLLGRLFEQGRTNYQFKKKFGVEGEPLFAYLPRNAPFSSILQYWSVFYQNSLTSAQLGDRLRKLASLPAAPRSAPNKFPSTPEERQAAWDGAAKIESIPYSGHPLDLMTDTWFGSESELVKARVEDLRRRRGADNLDALRGVFPFKHLILTRQGREAEALFYGHFPKGRKKILTTLPWTSTLMHQLQEGFEVVELPAPSALDESSTDPFKGEIDLNALAGHLQRSSQSVAMAGLELLSNATGGHPLRLSHVRRVKALLREHRVPLVLDASRILRNAVLLKQLDPESRHANVWSLAQDILAEADYVVTSLTKDFGIPTGGLIATNDDVLAARIQEAQSAQKPADGQEALLIHASLADRPAIIQMIEAQLALVKSLQERLSAGGIPILKPSLGHAIVIDCSRCLSDPSSKREREELLRLLFIETGIRAGLHQSGQQRHGRLARCLRLAFPLGMSSEHEDQIFERLSGFFAGRSRASGPPAPLITDFSPLLTDTEKSSLGDAPKENEGIAIVGLNGRYPQADTHYDFWEGLRAGKNFVEKVPASRWDHREIFDSTLGKGFTPGRSRCQFGAFVHHHDYFEAEFFKLSPEEVAVMDPQERLAMEVVWGCLEDAGHTPARLGRDTGLFAGVTYNEFQKMAPRTSHSCFLTSRLAYFFDFHGPAMALDTGCASSMTAIDAACQSLRDKRCRAAIAVGANLFLHPDHYATLSPELSTTARAESTPFGLSDGWIPAEGVVAILLKPLEEAVAAGDHIYAVIKSSLVGQEGKTSWFTAPNPRRQAALIEANFERAGLQPSTISYVEAAANGSPLGDAIEVEGLTIAFRKSTKQAGFCALGTVKSNVGHGEGVSTLLQLTRVLLQMKTGEIYPLLHREALNPNLRLEGTPFRLPERIENWERPAINLRGKNYQLPRRAAIFSFGGAGNIGHLILEEPPARARAKDGPPLCLIPMSAPSPERLKTAVAALISFLDRIRHLDSDSEETYRVWNVMRTLSEGRNHFAHRVAFVARDLLELKKLGQAFLRDEQDSDIVHPEGAPTDNIDARRLFSSRAWHELGRQWVAGAEIPWGELFAGTTALRAPLPSFIFSGRRHEVGGAMFFRESPVRRTLPADPCDSKLQPLSVSGNRGLAGVVLSAFSKVLSIPESEIDPLQPLDQYGFDSAMVAGVALELEKQILTVPQTLFFECGTISDVVEYLTMAGGETSAPAGESRPSSSTSGSAPAASDSDAEDLAGQILADRLTPDQILERLA